MILVLSIEMEGSMHCPHCNQVIDPYPQTCPNCGKIVDMDPSGKKTEGTAIGWGILGFILPIVGIILMFAWLHYKPRASAASGVGAFLGIIVALILSAQ